MDPQARLLVARERLAEGRSLLLKAKEAGPPCVRCVHFIPEWPKRPSGVAKARGPFCGHLAYSRQTFSPVDGKVSAETLTSPEKARAADGLCGPEGVLFERIPVVAYVKSGAAVAFLAAVALFAILV